MKGYGGPIAIPGIAPANDEKEMESTHADTASAGHRIL